MLFMLVQEENEGWLTEPLMDAVADYLECPKLRFMKLLLFIVCMI